MSNVKLKGVGKAILTYPDGHVEVFENGNMIVNSGLELLIGSLINTGANRPNPLSYVAIGTGAGVTTAAMTALVTETNRASGTWTHTSGTNTFKITAAFARGAVVGTIKEGGVFNAASSGTMFDRVLFTSAIPVTSDVAYTQEFTFTVE